MVSDLMQEAGASAIERAQAMAADLGLVLLESNDARNGRFRVKRGRDFIHLADGIEDAIGFMQSWREHVR